MSTAMDGGDELGDFFDEINKIEEVVTESGAETGAEAPAAAENAVDSLVVAEVVYSKPAEIKSQTTVTYDYTSMSSMPVDDYYGSAYGSSSTFADPGLAAFAPPPPPNVPVKLRVKEECVRKAAGEVWVDDSLKDWPEGDFRIFVGDLGKDVTTEMLGKAFTHYKSYAKAKVLRTKTENKARGFGFVSFLDPMDCAKAIREMNGKYLGARPMKISKSTWDDRDIKEVHKKNNKKRKMYESLGINT